LVNLTLAASVSIWQLTSSLSAQAPTAKALISQAILAQGGEDKLHAIKSIQWEAVGYRNELEQSERPEGPYIVEFDAISETHDYAGRRYRRIVEASVYPGPSFSSGLVVADGIGMAVSGPSGPDQVKIAAERQALSPESLLLTASDAKDLELEPDVVLQAIPQRVLKFTLDGAPVKVYLNPYTKLPTAVDYSGPLAHSGYWRYLGDVTSRTYFSLWWIAKGGIHLPLQWNVETNGLPDQMLTIKKLEINEPLAESELTIPAEVRAKFRPNAPAFDLDSLPLGNPRNPAAELAPGIVFIPGAWNTTLIDQGDGVVVLEAPISSGYTEKILAEAHRRFPDKPVKAVITTSDSWPHLAGIRECVAQGIEVYALDLNRAIIKRVVAASYASKPDDLQRSPRKLKLQIVHDKTALGTGPNRLEIYPIRGETSERQMMVYFPERKLLYGSDPFQPDQNGGYYYPQTVSELTDAVAREHLSVDRFFMMHIGPTPWVHLTNTVEQAARSNTPDGR
jgi:hypothetical protein